MSGTFSIAYTQQFDTETGRFLSGGLLYVYDANTTNLVSVYEDSGLTLSQANPAELDSGGRVPALWVADGNYRLVLRNADGVTQFDITSTPAIGTSTSGSSSSSGTTVDADSLLKTGYPIWLPVSGTLTGFVRMNGRTISSGSGAGSERANADCQDLFLYAWTNFSDSLCPVSGGRGATAAADWAANKAIATLDMRGRCPYGLDDMGNSAGSIIASATSAAGALGQESKAILQANLPNVNFSSASLTATPSLSVGTSITNGTLVGRNISSGSITQGGGSSISVLTGVSSATLSLASGTVSGTVSVGGNVPSGGSDTALATLSPGRAGSWYWRL